MTTSETHALSLSDIDRVLPEEYEVLPPGDAHNEHPHILRTVRSKASGKICSFSNALEYFTFAVSIAPHTRLLVRKAARVTCNCLPAMIVTPGGRPG